MIKKVSLIVIFFTFVAILATFPLVKDISHQLYGQPHDALGVVWGFWHSAYSQTQGLPARFRSMINYPQGIDITHSPHYPVAEFINNLLTRWWGEIASYNLQIMLSFILSGLFMYWLIFMLFRNHLVAIVIGTLYSLSPYHMVHAWEHQGLANIHWMVLYIIAIFNLLKTRTIKSAFLAGVGLAIVGWFDYYYLYFMAIFSLAAICFVLIYDSTQKTKPEKNKPFWRLTFIVMAVSIALLLPSVFHLIQFKLDRNKAKTNIVDVDKENKENNEVADYTRPFRQLFADSARPLNYLLPSSYHPISGKLTKPLIGTFLYGENPPEQTLYLGWVGIFLAFFGFKQWREKIRLEAQEYEKTNENFNLKFSVFMFVLFFVCSLPPYLKLGNFFLPFPSFFLYKIVPVFRNYARMGVVVLIMMCVLSGFGLTQVFAQIKKEKKKIVLSSILCCLIFFDFLPYPPFRIIDLKQVPPVYEWLKNEPKDTVIAEYPLEADIRHYIFYQRMHQKKMLNGAPENSNAAKLQRKISDLNSAATPGILAYIGIDYVLVHKDRYLAYEGGGVLGVVPDLSKYPGFMLVKSFKDVDVFKVKAQPINPETVENSDFKNILDDQVIFMEQDLDKNNNWQWGLGDKLSYQVKYFGFITVLNLTLEVAKVQNSNDILLTANASPSKLLSFVLKGEASVSSLFSKNDFMPLEYQETYQIKGYPSHTKKALFNHQNLVMSQSDRKVKIFPHTQDPLSAFFYLPGLDLKLNKLIKIYLNSGKSNYLLDGKIIAQETIRSKRCWRFEANIFEIKNEIKPIARVIIWLDNKDKNKIIQLNAQTKFGSIKVQLR